MQLVYKSERIKDPKVYLARDLRETIFWLEGTDDGDDYVIKMSERLYKILNNELIPLDDLPRPDLKRFRGYEYIKDNNIEDGCYCIYRKKEVIIMEGAKKTLREWDRILGEELMEKKLDIYRKERALRKNEPIKLTPVKTLNEWYANIPLIQKIDHYNSHIKIIANNLK